MKLYYRVDKTYKKLWEYYNQIYQKEEYIYIITTILNPTTKL